MSDAGSRSTVQVNVDSDSDDDASLFEEKVKTRFSSGNPAPSEGTADTDMPDKLAMMVVVGHETTPVTSEAQNKPAEDAGDTTAGQLIESSDKVRAKKKTGLEKGGSSKPTDLLSVIKEVDEIMNTPVNKDTPLDEVEELRLNMLKHSDFLRKREEHVESLAKKIEKE